MTLRFTRPWKVYAKGDIITPENDAIAREFLAAGLCELYEPNKTNNPKQPEANKATEPAAVVRK